MNLKKGNEPRKRCGLARTGLGLLLLLAFSPAACAPDLYSIDMKYKPSAAVSSRTQGETGKVHVTVATFEDARKNPDKMIIGRVIKTDGGKIPVLPKFVKPDDAVTAGIREYLKKAGYAVSGEKPSWDLKADSLRKEWGNIVIGGSIEDLDVSCEDLMPQKKYRAKARLTVYFADTNKKWIFYKTTTESSSSLDHVLFSEQRLEEQINGVLSNAVEKVFEAGEAERKITAVLREKSEPSK